MVLSTRKDRNGVAVWRLGVIACEVGALYEGAPWRHASRACIAAPARGRPCLPHAVIARDERRHLTGDRPSPQPLRILLVVVDMLVIIPR
jgi:hypothetical protein